MAKLILNRGDSSYISQIPNNSGELLKNTDTGDLLVSTFSQKIPVLKATRTGPEQEAKASNKFTIQNNVIVGEDHLPVIDIGVVHNGTLNYTCRLTQRYDEEFGSVEHDEEWFIDLPLIVDSGIFHVMTYGLPFVTLQSILSSGILSNVEPWYARYFECLDWAQANGIKLMIDVANNYDAFEQAYTQINGPSGEVQTIFNNMVADFKARVGSHTAVAGFKDDFHVVTISKDEDPQGIVARDKVIHHVHENDTPTIAIIEAIIDREPISFQVEAATRSGVQLSYFSEWKRDRDGSLGTIHTYNTTGESAYAKHMIEFGADYIYGNKLPNNKRGKIEIYSDTTDANNGCLTGGQLTMPVGDGTGARWANLLDAHGGHHGVSVSFWLRQTGDVTGTKNIITRQSDNGKYGYKIEAIDGHLRVTGHWHDQTVVPSWRGGDTFTDSKPVSNDWDFYVFQTDNTTKKMNVYRNGARIYELDTTGLNYTTPSADGTLQILGDGGFNIAQVTYYYRELESREINTLYVYDLMPARDVFKDRWSCAVARFNFASDNRLGDSVGFVTIAGGVQYIIDENLIVPELTSNEATFDNFIKPTHRKVE